MDWGTCLVFEHHSIHVLHAQYHFPQSKVTKQYHQKVSGKLGTYQYVLVHTWYILVCTGWRTCTFSREWCSFLMIGNHNILAPHTHYHFPQAKVTKLPVHTVSGKLCTDQYIPWCTSEAHHDEHTTYADHTYTSFPILTLHFRHSSVLWT